MGVHPYNIIDKNLGWPNVQIKGATQKAKEPAQMSRTATNKIVYCLWVSWDVLTCATEDNAQSSKSQMYAPSCPGISSEGIVIHDRIKVAMIKYG